jgi:Uma2 family endonuclease
MDTLAPSGERRTTRAAEGLPRWRWTTAELVRLTELGAFRDDDAFELIGGEIVPMSPTSRRHEIVREELAHALRRHGDETVRVAEEPQFNATDDTFTKPDILIRPLALKTPDLRGPDVLLLVEIAHTSLRKDTGFKAALYAGHGVTEYWVVDVGDLSVRVHRKPHGAGYADTIDVEATTPIAPHLVPHLSVRLADLDVT